MASPTRPPRPTFTPLSGGGEDQVRGALPPGVTVAVSPTAQLPGGTPTPIVLYATPTGLAPQALAMVNTPSTTATARPSPSPAGPTPTPRPTPYVLVNGGVVEARRGPDKAFELLGDVRQGQKLMVLARTADNKWWQVCCVANQPAWIPASAVTAEGAAEAAPPLPVPPTPTPTIPPTPTRTLTPSATPAPPFDIARGPEFPIQRDDGILVVWAKVYEGPPDNQKPLPGYVLKVFRNGVDVSKPSQSEAPSSGFNNSGPSEGNYQYNLKYEKDFGGEADWQIYLARPDGTRVSPITKFTTMGDSYRNLTVFIAYRLAR